MRRRVVGALAVLLAGAILRVVVWRPFSVSGTLPEDGFVRLAGVVHVHTTRSDGGGSPEEVVAEARKAGLGFVALTDHNNLDAKNVEGYHDGVLVLVGTEVSTTAGHLVGLGLPDPLYRFSGDPADALSDVQDAGGVAFAAHPLSPREDFRWTGWDLPGAWGMEIVNGDSQWREAGWGRLLWTAGLYALNPRYALLGSLTPPTAALSRWDTALARRDVAGIAGADAHSRLPLSRSRTVRFPSYAWLFALAQNHVLLDRPLSGNTEADVAAVVSALGRGRSYVGLDALASAAGFFFVAELGDRQVTMGETTAATPGLTLKAGGRLPPSARIMLLKDGATLAQGTAGLECPAAGPGVYRVEVYLPRWPIPWILSNPIYLFEGQQAEDRRARAARPDQPTGPPAVASLDPVGAPSLAAEFDTTSWMERDVLGPHEGPDGRPASRLFFRLGTPTSAHPFVSAALVSRKARDLRGRVGLVLSVKSDRPYRVWVQVRDLNPASLDDGTEWWFASLRTSPAWRRVAVPFDRLRSINPKTDGHLDLDKVAMVAFVLDQGSVKPGTEGRIWIADLGFY
ncbi:MAG: PHP domain-containing protein [Vicinamibacteria bacterium]